MRTVTVQLHWPALAVAAPVLGAACAYAVDHRDQLSRQGGWVPFTVGVLSTAILAVMKPAVGKAPDAPRAAAPDPAAPTAPAPATIPATPVAPAPAAAPALDLPALVALLAPLIADLVATQVARSAAPAKAASPLTPALRASDAPVGLPAYDPAAPTNLAALAVPNTTPAAAAAATAALPADQRGI